MNTTRLLVILMTLVVIVGLLAACGSPAATPTATSTSGAVTTPTVKPVADTGKVYNWRLQCIYPPTQLTFKINEQYLIPMIEKVTGGRIKITQYPPGSLAPSSELIAAVGAGQFEMADMVAVYEVGKMPEGYIEFCMPAGIRDFFVGKSFCWEFYPMLEQAYNEHGVHKFLQEWGGGYYGTISTKPLTGVADIKGKKIRTTGLFSNVLAALGGSPTTLALEDIYTGLTLGTVDAQTYSGPATWFDNKYVEPAKYFVYPPEGGASSGGYIINKKLWDSLPSDLQDQLQAAIYLASQYRSIQSNQRDEWALQQMLTTYGCKQVTWSAADVEAYKQAAWKVWDEVVATKNDRCAKSIQLLKDWTNKEKHPYLWLPRESYIGMK